MAKQDAKPIRLMVVDDHEVVRVGLTTVIQDTAEMELVGEADTVKAAVTEAVRLKPDVVLMDVRLPDGSGVEACRKIREASPDTRVLFLTSFADDEAAIACLLGGAQGYLLKGASGRLLTQAIHTVAAGQSIIDPSITKPILAKMQASSTLQITAAEKPLSVQEQRIVSQIAEGHTNKEIAEALGLSDKTVKNHIHSIFKKLRVTRRSQAVAEFFRQKP